MAEASVIRSPACRVQLDLSAESSQSSPTDSSEHEANSVPRPPRRYISRGRKRLQQGQCQMACSVEDEEDKKRRRAKKERTRVSNLAIAYQSLARTIGLYPLRGSQKRITHEQILQEANKLILDLKQELDCLRNADGRIVVVNGSPPPAIYTPAKHYTISSSGEVVVVEEADINSLDHLDLSCNETLPLPTLDESDGSSDIPCMQENTQASAVPLLNYELLSPSNQPSVSDTQIQHILGLNGETPSSMNSFSTMRQGFLLSSPPFTSLITHAPAPSYQAYASPADIGAYEEIVNEEMGTSNNTPLVKGPIAA